MNTTHTLRMHIVRILALGAFAIGLLIGAPHGAAANQGSPVPAPDDVQAPPKTAQKSKSGLAWRVLQAGHGKTHPSEYDEVTVRYTGWQTDGTNFDASAWSGGTATFKVNQVIKGWTEGLQLMVDGEKRRFWIPAVLAYQGVPDRPQGMLVFDVELVSFKAGVKPPPAPPDVAAMPKDCKKTASGIGYRVLRRGTGTKHPTAQSTVTIHYTLWTTDGKCVDSSVMHPDPTTINLAKAFKGWQEGVPLMVEGEKTRFWIPEELAFKGRPGAPQGMLVFEIELLKIAS